MHTAIRSTRDKVDEEPTATCAELNAGTHGASDEDDECLPLAPCRRVAPAPPPQSMTVEDIAKSNSLCTAASTSFGADRPALLDFDATVRSTNLQQVLGPIL
jgi:hypothetical protein